MPTQVDCDVTTLIVTNLGMPKGFPKEFGAWIKQKREQLRLSQAGAANRAEIDRQQWFRIENGISGTRLVLFA